MTTLVVGASGATGRLLVEQLLKRGQKVRVIVRSPNKLPAGLTNHPHVSVISASVLELSDAEISQHVSGCRAVASCLEAVRRARSARGAAGLRLDTNHVWLHIWPVIDAPLEELVSLQDT